MTRGDNRDVRKAICCFLTKFAGLSSLESCRIILSCCLWLRTPDQGTTFQQRLEKYEAIINEPCHLHNFCQRPCRQESLVSLESEPRLTLKLGRSGFDLEDDSPQTADLLRLTLLMPTPADRAG